MSSSMGDIRLIVRGDDMGSLHSSNVAVKKAFEKGILTCAAIIAPAPWAPEAAEMAKTTPSWCIGAHLSVIGEWRGYPWRPILPYSEVASLVDEDGFLHKSPKEFFQANPNFTEVKSELRAQIEFLRKWGVNLCYLDSHYIGYVEQKGIENLFAKAVKELSKEYSLPVSGLSGEKHVPGVYTIPPLDKEHVLVKQLEELSPGLWLLVSHLLVDSPESQALVHTEPADVMKEGVGNHRLAELKCLVSPRVKETILRKGIKLVSYRNIGEG